MNDKVPLYNSRLMKIYLDYISKYHPDVSIDSILDNAGITWYEVEDPAHWFNQEQIDGFHEILVKTTDNANIARDAGRYSSTSAAAGAVRQYALGLMNMTTVYLLMERGELASIRIGRSVRIRPEDLEKFIESKTQSQADIE